MSGTGKSTALTELARRGHRVVDTDDPGWIVNVDTPHGPEPVWDLDRVGALLDDHRAGWLFVSGCVASQGALYDRFGAVVLLSAPLEVIRARLVDRANPFGSQAEDRARIESDLAVYEPLLRAGVDREISTTAPVAEVVAALNRSRPRRWASPGPVPTMDGEAGSPPDAYPGAMSSQRVPGGVVHKLPVDLREALIANTRALDAWQDITPLARNEFICWVDDAKQETTRERRIRRTQEELEEGQRRPCCWPGCKHRERTGS